MIRIDDDGKHRVVSDDMNPRIHVVEGIRCQKCGEMCDADAIEWFETGPGEAKVPRCDNCHPAEPVARCKACDWNWSQDEMLDGRCPKCKTPCTPFEG